MRRTTLKLLACAGVAAFGTTLISTQPLAQTATVPITVTQSASISISNVADIAFGEWMLVHDGSGGGGNITLAMATDGTVTPAAGASSQAVLIAAGNVGEITVQTPAAGDITICGAANGAFTGANYAFSLPVYDYAGLGSAALPACGGPDTVAATGGVDTVTLGGTLTIDGTPDDGADSASYDVTVGF